MMVAHERHLVDAEATVRPPRPHRRRQPAQRRGEGDPRGHPPGLRRRRRPLRHGLVRGRRPPGAASSPGVRQGRPARHAPRGLRLRRHVGRRLRAGLPRARGERLRHPLAGVGAGQPRDVRDLAVRHRGAEAGVAAADGGGRGDRLLRPHRARPRLRPRLDAHPRPSRRRRLGAQRLEDVDHQRLDRRRRGRLGQRGRGERRHPRLRGAHRHPGIRRATRSPTRCRCARRSPPSSPSRTSASPRMPCSPTSPG